jgi:hypothetical protein
MKIAFYYSTQLSSENFFGLALLDVKTGQETALSAPSTLRNTISLNLLPPVWSCDGKVVYFMAHPGTAAADESERIHSVAADGSAQPRCVTTGISMSASPTEGNVLFTGDEGNVYEVRIMPDKVERKILYREPCLPLVSPLGDFVALSGRDAETDDQILYCRRLGENGRHVIRRGIYISWMPSPPVWVVLPGSEQGVVTPIPAKARD